MNVFSSVFRMILVCGALAACGGSSGSTSDAALSPTAACEAVGSSFCARMYACYSVTDLMTMFGLPATEAACVTQENAQCGAAAPSPGYCKGKAQTSASAATACSAELDGLTCTQLMQPSSGVCKTQLCAM